jgi:hypothetical protein
MSSMSSITQIFCIMLCVLTKNQQNFSHNIYEGHVTVTFKHVDEFSVYMYV